MYIPVTVLNEVLKGFLFLQLLRFIFFLSLDTCIKLMEKIKRKRVNHSLPHNTKSVVYSTPVWLIYRADNVLPIRPCHSVLIAMTSCYDNASGPGDFWSRVVFARSRGSFLPSNRTIFRETLLPLVTSMSL